ncbi:hypothetical protein FF38_14443 [Lucilia cuprina]|uniref:Uncharacterized protein n=1 Tax=Lucilia cuprina TaxID=7375 RepID=A0A0L0BWC9_LUCCU|nr:hypothetical protein FF38_14443 [Lucilia cuprina]
MEHHRKGSSANEVILNPTSTNTTKIKLPELTLISQIKCTQYC